MSIGSLDNGTAPKSTYPSMLIMHPSGTANCTIVFGTFLFNSVRIVTGNVAALLAVPHAVASAGVHLIQYA